MVNEERRRRGIVLVDGAEVKAQQVANQIALAKAVEKHQIHRIFTFHSSIRSAASFTATGPEGVRSQDRKRGELRNEYRKQLEEIGFLWDANERNESHWQTMFAELRTFKERHGHSRVTEDYSKKLANWTKRQRKDWKKGRLTDERKKLLDTVEFMWDSGDEANDSWEQMFALLARYKSQFGSCRVPDSRRQKSNLGRWVRSQRQARRKGRLREDRIKRLSQIGFAWQPYDSNWETMLVALKAYHQKHRNCNVPKDWPENPGLSKWVRRQRALKNKQKLRDDRVQTLSALGFVWIGFDWSLAPARAVSPRESWEAMLDQLTQFHAEHRHARVPQNHAPNKKLAWWVSTQRRNLRIGKLTPSQIAQLDQLGFDWSPTGSKAYDEQWRAMFDALQNYRKQNGHCRVPRSYPENPILARWVATQRRLKKRRHMRPERLSALEQIGFDSTILPESSLTLTEAWDAMFEVLKEYKTTHGDCLVPQRWRENRKLAEWVSKQRIQHNKGRLDAERERRLKELGFEWDPVTAKWEEWFAQLLEFKRSQGHTNVPQRAKQYLQLANWVRNQRRDKKMNRPIMKERAKRLDEIGFSWKLVEPQGWEQMFAALVEYKRAHGDCNVPQSWRENKRLGKWVNTQRTHYKRGKLHPDRQRQLESIGFVWNAAATRRSTSLSSVSNSQLTVLPLPSVQN